MRKNILRQILSYRKEGHSIFHWNVGNYTPRNTASHYKVRTYLLTPWCRVLLEKLTGLQLVKKFPHFTEPEGSLPHLTYLLNYSLHGRESFLRS